MTIYEIFYQVFLIKNPCPEWYLQHQDFERIYKICCSPASSPPKEFGKLAREVNEIAKNKEAMKTLKEKSPEDYKKLKFTLAKTHMLSLVTHLRKSDFVLVTQRLQVGDKKYAISQYLTWMYRDYLKDPVDRMTHHSIVAILHQDPFLIHDMLADIAKIFKKSLEWDKKDIKELMQNVALLEYEFIHSMPHKRGSGAIAELIERTIFGFWGYKLTYNDKKMVTFEAYISTLQEFVENYNTMISLEKIGNTIFSSS